MPQWSPQTTNKVRDNVADFVDWKPWFLRLGLRAHQRSSPVANRLKAILGDASRDQHTDAQPCSHFWW